MMRREVEAGRPVVGGAHGRRRQARQGRGRPARGEARGAGGRHLARGPAAGVTVSSPASSGPPSGNISSSPFLPHRPAAAMAHVRIKSKGLHSPGGGDSGCQAEVTPATRWLTSLRHQPRHPYPRAPAPHRHICRSCSGPHRPDPARVTAAGGPISGGGSSTPRRGGGEGFTGSSCGRGRATRVVCGCWRLRPGRPPRPLHLHLRGLCCELRLHAVGGTAVRLLP
ncbi:unnamed protein product [Urochloa humidicola]